MRRLLFCTPISNTTHSAPPEGWGDDQPDGDGYGGVLFGCFALRVSRTFGQSERLITHGILHGY